MSRPWATRDAHERGQQPPGSATRETLLEHIHSGARPALPGSLLEQRARPGPKVVPTTVSPACPVPLLPQPQTDIFGEKVRAKA